MPELWLILVPVLLTAVVVFCMVVKDSVDWKEAALTTLIATLAVGIVLGLLVYSTNLMIEGGILR